MTLQNKVQSILKERMRFNTQKASAYYPLLSFLSDRESISQTIAAFQEQLTREHNKSLIKDIVICNYCYGITANEYFLYNFQKLADDERRNFVGYEYKLKICKILRPSTNATLLSNKAKCYSVFREFYRRDLIEINSSDQLDEFQQFCAKHQKMIVKPVSGNEGKGIYILDVAGKELKKEFGSILNKGVCVIEELVQQAPALGCFHPNSVNTIRVVTYNTGHEVKILWTLFRMGQGGSFVDNASAGGIIAAVDQNTGVIHTQGYSETAKCLYDYHPETKQRICGYSIPYWDELKQQVQRMAMLIPDYHFVGWDLALTDSGWTMIEANSGPSFVGTQLCEQIGKWPLIESLGIMNRP